MFDLYIIGAVLLGAIHGDRENGRCVNIYIGREEESGGRGEEKRDGKRERAKDR